MRKPTILIAHFMSRIFLFRGVILFALTALLASSAIDAQRPQYKISASLDTSLHQLTGIIEIEYTNDSYHTLDSLGIHLWPNAYSTKNTALVKQMLNVGDIDLYKAKSSDLGSITGMNFVSPEQTITFLADSHHIDIAWLKLEKPLRPGSAIRISSPFIVKIPQSYSRLGRTGHSYQMTQWYPHLAVFDENGWQTMPYLDQGEFFNDFADYDVSIMVPEGYTVAATGTHMPNSDDDTTTVWRFKAENVIDFAWFTSPAFRHENYSVDVGGDYIVELHLYVDALADQFWDQASVYATRALQFYSDWLGPYPYPQMSVVYAPLGAGGGMEYPMITQIGDVTDASSLDIIIAHEIGHVWLYGILANNERAHPWMDEGLNSFIESQYISQYYPEYEEYPLPKAFQSSEAMSSLDVLQHSLQFNHTLQPPATDPETQQDYSYFYSAYELPSQGLKMMMSREGEDVMKQMFRDYYKDYKFSHVTPEILRQSFEKTCECDLAWFFEDWIHHAHEVDYRIKKFSPGKKEVTIVNKGKSTIPFEINTFKNGEPLKQHWINGFKGEKIIHLNVRADEIRLYDGMMSINKDFTSTIKPRASFPRFRFLPQVERYDGPTIGVTPFFGVNLADGFMPGIAFTSGLFPQHRFKFVIAPMYGLGSKELRGHATFRYIGDLKQGPFDKFLLSFGLDDFGYNLDTHYLFRDHYFKWSPTLALRVQPNDKNPHLTQWWKYRYVHIDQYYGRGVNYVDKLYDEEHRSYGVHELLYQMSSDYVLRPFTAMANVQAGAGFVRLNLRYNQHFVGKNVHKGIWVQGYGGWLPVYDDPDANVAFTFNGISSNGFYSKDFMYDEWLGGRNAVDGIFAQQVFIRDAGLKTLSTIGIGSEWMLGGGVSVASPFRYIHMYMDMALFPSAVTQTTQFSYSGGVSLVLLKDVFEVYLPFLESEDIRNSLSYEVKDQWYERISFQANIKLFNPLNIIDREQLAY